MGAIPDPVREVLRELRGYMPRVRQAHWLRLEPIIQTRPDGSFAAGEVFSRSTDGLKVLVSLDITPSQGVMWLHVSASHKDRTPTWDDMCDVKRNFIGEDKYAVQMHPPRDEYLNRATTVLHLWHNVLGKTVPDEGFDRMSSER